MNLFAAAGIDLGNGGRGGRSGRPAVSRTLKVPLLNHKVVLQALRHFTFDLSPQQIEAAANYAKTVKNPKFAKLKETEVRNLFCQKVLGEILGYTQVDADPPYTLAFERAIRRGSVDVALGRFGAPDGDEIVAPFELKGPGTADLDAIMPGRGYSPVQQAWNYAIDAPGSRWVLVSNCVEIRLYGFGRGRDAYELFDLTQLEDPRELERLWLLLSAPRLLGGALETLLRESDSAYKDITGELYVEYKALRERIIAFLTGSADGPKLPMAGAIELAQKTLDRILFVAFAERTDLLPAHLIERASKARNEFNPVPYWTNFQALFHKIDVGDEGRGIWAYNGGLFAADPVADTVVLPDPLTEELAKLANWDYRSDVPVTVLGHIFEQSITDLEKLRAESRGEEAPKVSKRKREGVVYTPDIVTRFLVERTIGLTLSEAFNALIAKHGKEVPKNGDPIFADTERETERAFWREYMSALRALRIVDPACGSGAFLVAAFDMLAAEYRRVAEHLVSLGEAIDFDPFDEIVTKNLYGVDLNAESVEITRLALWLKTARNKHRLQNLEATIKAGNSLIDDPKFTDHPFDWHKAFSDVFAQGGFDIVIGNPPYVRSETISKVKPSLKVAYTVFDSGADLYCYFYEKALSVLKDDGRLGFISSSGFFKTSFGRNLRTYLSKNAIIESGIDFGDTKIFEDVTTYPSVLTMRKAIPRQRYEFAFLNYSGERNANLGSHFNSESFLYPSSRLSRSRWHFEPENLAKLRDRLEDKAVRTLGDLGIPVSGIKTGLTKAFVIGNATKERLISTDPNSIELLRTWTVGDDLERWATEEADHYLVFIPKGWTKSSFGDLTEQKAWSRFNERYPAIAHWLSQFEDDSRKRSDKGDFWWELRACDYYELFDQEVVTFPEMSQGPKFALKPSQTVSNNKTFLIPKSDPTLLAFLNSRASWFLLLGICTALRGGQWRLELRADFLKELLLPDLESAFGSSLKRLAVKASATAQTSYKLKREVRKRLFDLASSKKISLSRKLEDWWMLDFAAFRDEVKRFFRAEIPVKERGEWESYLAKHAAEVKKLDAEIEKAEREIDAIVYRLFDLTPEEIVLLEQSIAGQH